MIVSSNSTTSTELLTLLLPNLIGRYITISWSVLCTDWICVAKVKVQNFIESLSILYFLYH